MLERAPQPAARQEPSQTGSQASPQAGCCVPRRVVGPCFHSHEQMHAASRTSPTINSTPVRGDFDRHGFPLSTRHRDRVCLGRLDETNNRRTQLGHRRRFGFPSRAMPAPQRPHVGALSLLKKRSTPHLWHFTISMQPPWSVNALRSSNGLNAIPRLAIKSERCPRPRGDTDWTRPLT